MGLATYDYVCISSFFVSAPSLPFRVTPVGFRPFFALMCTINKKDLFVIFTFAKFALLLLSLYRLQVSDESPISLVRPSIVQTGFQSFPNIFFHRASRYFRFFFLFFFFLLFFSSL